MIRSIETDKCHVQKIRLQTVFSKWNTGFLLDNFKLMCIYSLTFAKMDTYAQNKSLQFLLLLIASPNRYPISCMSLITKWMIHLYLNKIKEPILKGHDMWSMKRQFEQYCSSMVLSKSLKHVHVMQNLLMYINWLTQMIRLESIEIWSESNISDIRITAKLKQWEIT